MYVYICTSNRVVSLHLTTHTALFNPCISLTPAEQTAGLLHSTIHAILKHTTTASLVLTHSPLALKVIRVPATKSTRFTIYYLISHVRLLPRRRQSTNEHSLTLCEKRRSIVARSCDLRGLFHVVAVLAAIT